MNFLNVAFSLIPNRLWRRSRSIASSLFANLVAVLLYIGTRALFHIQVQGLHKFNVSPATIIVISHKRDLDEIIIPPTLHISKTLFRPRFRMWFAARDDLFVRGFLSSHFRLPYFLARFLSTINLSVVMAAFRALPIGCLKYSQVGRLLRDVYEHEGNLALKDVLKAEWIAEFASLMPPSLDSNLNDTSLKDFLCWDYRHVHALKGNLNMLQSDVLKRTRAFQLRKIDGQLRHFSGVLDGGGILFFTPGDNHSPDGRFGPMKGGICRLIRMAQTDVRIVPVNITYDFMTTGRKKVHIAVGAEITNLKRLTKCEIERRLQRAITTLGAVNLGQLGSHCLLKLAQVNRRVITKELLARRILSKAQKLSRLGLSIDNNILSGSQIIGGRLDKFIRYCVKNQWLRYGKDGKLLINTEAMLDVSQSNSDAHPIQYCHNELMALQSAYGIEEA